MATNSKPTILVTHSQLPDTAIDMLRKSCNVIICQNENGLPQPTREEILSKSKGVDGILWATRCKLNAEVLDAAGPQLRSISTKSAGLDFVNVTEVKLRGIPLGYTPTVLNDAVADVAIGLLIAAARRFHEGRLKIDNNKWEQGSPIWMLGQDIKGSTVGIVGLGGIGQAVVKRLKGFDVGKFLYTGHAPKPEGDDLNSVFVSLDELLKQSDFVIVTCPLNNETRGLFNATNFAKMKPTSVFVNVARGDIVNQVDLIEALKNGTIFSAGLDVTSPEPLQPDHPLTQLDNCVITPHIGFATNRTDTDMATIAALNVLAGLYGEPMHSPVLY